MLVLFCPTVRVIPVTAVAVVDKTELLPLKLTLDLTLERLEAAVFLKTLTYIWKKMLRGKYKTIKERK